jgi:cysteine desulfurase
MAGVNRIYFDHAATTPLDPRVAQAMHPFAFEVFGNPSSLHHEGRLAREAVEKARGEVAALAGAAASEVVFTASGTEANNMALRGVAEAFRGKPFHLISSAIEHPSVVEVCRTLMGRDVALTLLPVGADGMVEPGNLTAALRPETKLVSIMAANNVVGTLQPVRALARIARDHGALFHTDAVQALGKAPLTMREDGIDLMSVSAHKLHGPKGVGALLLRQGTPFRPLILGGGQERGRRSATENTSGIAGFGEAARIARLEMHEEAPRLARLREMLWEGIRRAMPQAYRIGHPGHGLPGHLCLGFHGLEGEAIKILLALDDEGIAVSSGSACSAHHAGEPSHVLSAMGMDPVRARGSLRITLGRFNTETEIARFLDVLPRVAGGLKPLSLRPNTSPRS